MAFWVTLQACKSLPSLLKAGNPISVMYMSVSIYAFFIFTSKLRAYVIVLNATYSRIMYLIHILTIEINNNNNKNDIVWLILSLFFSQSQIDNPG
jgi:membrane-bound acyltransferase YfiQ involved in biofilm formation